MNISTIKKLSAGGLILIALWEGYERLPYKDIGGIWTDGFGNTKQVVPGKPIEVPQALERLDKNVEETHKALIKCIKVPLNQNQSDAFLSLAYNIGSALFCKSGLTPYFNEGDSKTLYSGNKHLIDYLNEGNYREACRRILLYHKVRINGKLVPSRGLQNRRQAEYELCMKPEN